MLNLSDERLDDCISRSLKNGQFPTQALKEEIWAGLMVKVEAHLAAPAASPDPADTPVACRQEALITWGQHALYRLNNLLQGSVQFLFADEILLERAHQKPLHHRHYLVLMGRYFVVANA